MALISFEGCDYVGKSTQIKLLATHLTKLGKKVHLTREPGGSKLAEKIRSIILTAQEEIKDPLVEYLLLAAARRDHVENVIKPKLKDAYFVLTDRFYDSSLCYQGYVKGLKLQTINHIKDLTIGDFQPHLSILLILSEEELCRRINNKRRDDYNVYDNKTEQFYFKIQKHFKKIAATSESRFITVTTDGQIRTAHRKILTALEEKKII